MKTSVLRLSDLCVNIDGQRVLSHVNLDIAAGQMVGIAGPNGGGKTTLLRAILGLAPTCCGTAEYFGSARLTREVQRRIGYVPQNAAHVDARFPASAREVALLGRVTPRGLLRRLNGEDERLADEALAEVGMSELKHRPIGAMSGGQRQRVFLARALAGSPDLLLLDEPTTGVDGAARDSFVSLLRHLNADHGITIVLVSHDSDMLAHAADRLVVIDRGITYDGPIAPGLALPPHAHLHDPMVRP